MTDHVDYTKRRFLGRTALLGGGMLSGILARPAHAEAATGEILRNGRPDTPYTLNDAENQILSVCLNCNTGCGVKVKLQDGVVAKIDGSP